jgi:hypothetical protein
VLDREGFSFTVREKQGFLPHSTGLDKTLENYERLVLSYITRDLSRDEDIVNAFEGIMKTFAPALGTSIYGLPERHLDMALLWTTDDTSLVRRTGFPSWSWVGWKHRREIHLRGLSDYW